MAIPADAGTRMGQYGGGGRNAQGKTGGGTY